MGKIRFAEPSAAPRIPLTSLPGAWWRFAVNRGLPLRLAMRTSMWLRHAPMRRHADRMSRVAERLAELLGTTPDGNAEDLLLRVRTLRRFGAHTFAPVVARTPNWLRKTFRPRGLEHLDDLRESGSGAVILATHAGLNAWAGPILLGLGYDVRLIQRQEISAEKLLLLRISRWTSRVLPYPEPGREGLHLKHLHDLLRQGAWTQHVADHPESATGVSGKLFGTPVRCCRPPWTLARLADVPAVPVLVPTDEDLRPELVVGPPIRVSRDLPSRQAMDAAFQCYLDFVEETLEGRRWNLSPNHWAAIVDAATDTDAPR